MTTKQELEAHVISTQMIMRGVCSRDEIKERKALIKHLELDPDFHSAYNDSKRVDISKGVVKRRNAIYKALFDASLGKEEAIRLERYVYYCLIASTPPDPSIINLKLNI